MSNTDSARRYCKNGHERPSTSRCAVCARKHSHVTARKPHDYTDACIKIVASRQFLIAEDFRSVLRKLARDTLMRDWEINGAHQGEPSRAHLNRLARELIP